MKTSINIDDYRIEFNETNKLKEAVYKKILKWYFKHRKFCGDGIMQSDDTTIDAPELLSDIADDLFKFKIKYTK